MPVTLAKIAANTASVTVTGGTLGEDSVIVVYYPGRITEKLISQMLAFDTMSKQENISEAQMTGAFHDFNSTLCSLIKSWDVMEDDGVTMFPLDPVRIEALPLSFRMQVVYALVGDMRPQAAAPQK